MAELTCAAFLVLLILPQLGTDCGFLQDHANRTIDASTRDAYERLGATLHIVNIPGAINHDAARWIDAPSIDLPVFAFRSLTGGRLPQLPSVRVSFGIDLRRSGISDSGLSELNKKSNLRYVNLSNTLVTDDGLMELAGLKDLETLLLGKSGLERRNRESLTGRGIRHLAALPRLRHLFLSGARIGDNELRHLGMLRHLVALDLSDTGVTGAGLGELVVLKSLASLDLSFTQVGDNGLKAISRLETLMWLDLSTTSGISDVGVSDLAGLQRLVGLQLCGVPITDKGLGGVVALKNLRVLNLQGTRITDAGVTGLSQLSRLVELSLNSTKVGDAGIDEITGLVALESLDLGGSQISDRALRKLVGLTQLKALDVSNTKVSRAGIDQLRKALPGCRVKQEENDP